MKFGNLIIAFPKSDFLKLLFNFLENLLPYNSINPLSIFQISWLAVPPFFASKADCTPACAANPTWKAFISVPNCCFKPDEKLVAIEIAFAIWSAFNFNTLDTAAAVPITPIVFAECHPL